MIIDDITEYMQKELDITVKVSKKRNSNVSNVNLYRQDNVDIFYDWMYKDATIYLDRKYKKFAVLRQNREKS